MGDLLAVAVVKILTSKFAIRVSAVSTIATALFQTCNAVPWPALERSKLIIDIAAGGLEFIHDSEHTAFRRPVLVIPLQSSIGHLRTALLANLDHDAQRPLPFPPSPATPSSAGDATEAQA